MSCLREAIDQLMHARSRFVIALLGVAVAVVMMLVQLGLKDAHFRSLVRLHSLLDYDLVLMSVDTSDMVQTRPFSVRRLYQARSVPGVADVTPVHAARARWRSAGAPTTAGSQSVYAIGVDPDGAAFAATEMARLRAQLIQPDTVVFDTLSQPVYGPVLSALAQGRRATAMLNGREVEITGTFELGSSVGIDGAVLTSTSNFHRFFPERRSGEIDFGLVRARHDVDIARLARRISHVVPGDVLVLTRAGFMARERAYWAYYTPLGALLNLGTAVGALVGGVLVYQILFAGLTGGRARERALHASGVRRGFVARVLILEAALLAVPGFAVGAALALPIFRLTSAGTRLPLALELGLLGAVLALTLGMCAGSALWAVQQVPGRLGPAR